MRYYFDIRSPRSQTVDDVGCDFKDHDQVKAEALRVLARIAAEEGIEDGRIFEIEVRNQAGTPLFRGALTYDWQDIAAG